MAQESWPTPQHPAREPLPRVEDLPVADQGYEQESVKAAFDSFYRHAAQLDAALRTLEAVDSFQRQAAALRADLRTLRAAGWTHQPWGAPPLYTTTGKVPGEGISPTIWRIAGEAALLIAAAVALGVAKVAWWVIVAGMAGAWLIVGAIEWAAARERWVVPRPVSTEPHPVVEAEPPGERVFEEEAVGWAAFEQAQEPSDAMTMIGAPPAEDARQAEEEEQARVEDEEAPVTAAAGEEQPDVALAPTEEPARAETSGDEVARDEDKPQRRWWRRSSVAESAPAADGVTDLGLPRHVRVLSAEEEHSVEAEDPWERGFESDDAPNATENDEAEDVPSVAAEDSQQRRRFRRR